MWSLCLPIALSVLIPIVSGTFPFRNRNSDLAESASGGGGRPNNPRLPVSPEAYMSSVSRFICHYL